MGELGATQIATRVLDNITPPTPAPNETAIQIKQTTRPNKYKIDLDGLDNVEIHLAKCCNPVHGEPIVGFITQSQGVSIHQKDCPECQRLADKDSERIVGASWQSDFGRYQPTTVMVEAVPRDGLLRDLVNVIDKEKVNIHRAETVSADDSVCHMKFFVEVAGIAHLSRLLAKIEQQPSVVRARRSA